MSINITGPIDSPDQALVSLSTFGLRNPVGANAAIQYAQTDTEKAAFPANPYALNEDGNIILGELSLDIRINPTYDGIIISGNSKIINSKTGEWLSNKIIADTIVGLDDSNSLKSLGIMKQFGNIIKRVDFFWSVLSDKISYPPPVIWELRDAQIKNPNFVPNNFQIRGDLYKPDIPAGVEIGLGVLIALSVRQLCTGWNVNVRGKLYCVAGTTVGVTSFYYWDKIKNQYRAWRNKQEQPRNDDSRQPGGTSGGSYPPNNSPGNIPSVVQPVPLNPDTGNNDGNSSNNNNPFGPDWWL